MMAAMLPTVAASLAGSGPPASIKGTIATYMGKLFRAGIGMINSLFQNILDQFLLIDVGLFEQSGLNAVNQDLQIIFYLLLGLYALYMLGMYQLFPGETKTDPLRFGSRALAATVSLYVVNPPGPGTSTFGKGAIAWGVMATNAVIRMLSNQIGIATGSLVDQALIMGAMVALVNPFTQAAFILFFVTPVLLSIMFLLFGLVLRQILVFIVFGAYPVLILFWVVDTGPLKHGKKLSEKLLHSMVKTLVGGILIAAVLAMGTSIVQNGTQIFASRADLGPTGALFTLATMLMFIFVTCGLSAIMIKGMLGTLGDAAMKAFGGGVTVAATTATTAVATVATLPAGGVGGLASLGGSASIGGLGTTGGAATSTAGSAAASGASAAASGAASTTGSAATSGASAAASSGTSSVASGALSNTAQQGLQQTASKGLTGTMKQVGQKAGEKAAEKAPDAAKKAGKGAFEEGKSAVEETVAEGQAMGEDLEEPSEGDQPSNPSMSSRTYSST